jgi:hypothetical protein
MTPENFCYWLRGFFELEVLTSNKPDMPPNLTDRQVKVISDHLASVFEARLALAPSTITHSGAFPGMVESTRGPSSVLC